MRSFIIEQLLVIKKTAKETSSVGSSQSELNRLQDEITYLREECNTKNCIIQTLLENQKVIQNTVNTESFDKYTKIHIEPFIIPKNFASNIRTSLTKLQIALNYCPKIQEMSSKLIIFCQQKSKMLSKTTKLIMQMPQMRTEKAPPKIRETKMIKTKL